MQNRQATLQGYLEAIQRHMLKFATLRGPSDRLSHFDRPPPMSCPICTRSQRQSMPQKAQEVNGTENFDVLYSPAPSPSPSFAA